MHRTEGDNNVNNLYTDGPPATTVGAAALNSIQEEMANAIEYSGQTLQTRATDNYSQLTTALQTLLGYDFIVDTPTAFANIMERTGANTYQIKDEYLSVFFRQNTGGYSIASILSGGDTWGKIETNNCNNLIFESGAYFNFGDTQSYLEVNTDYCYLKNVEIRGIGTSAAAITQSFLLGADFVTYDGCKTRDRKSNVDFYGFKGSGTASHNRTGKYKDCLAYNLSSSGNYLYGFYNCSFLTNCKAITLIHTGAINMSGFKTCYNLNICLAYDMTGSATRVLGFDDCFRISTCHAEKIYYTGTGIYYGCGFHLSYQISNCYAYDISGTGTGATGGFNGIEGITGCKAEKIDATNVGSGDAHGFASCFYISGCYATDIDSVAGSADGFISCRYGSSIHTNETVNGSNDYMDTVDAQITNKTSCASIFT